jgi:hypothetical protein
MSDTHKLEEALALTLKLSPHERLRLVEQVVASVEREIAVGVPTMQLPVEHWGQALNRLLDVLDTSAWETLEVNDPVAWVKAIRRQDESRLDTYWNDPQ